MKFNTHCNLLLSCCGHARQGKKMPAVPLLMPCLLDPMFFTIKSIFCTASTNDLMINWLQKALWIRIKKQTDVRKNGKWVSMLIYFEQGEVRVGEKRWNSRGRRKEEDPDCPPLFVRVLGTPLGPARTQRGITHCTRHNDWARDWMNSASRTREWAPGLDISI